jgi:hypothetical protein
MAAQGPQMTLGGATRGDAVEAKGLAKSRDGLGHGHTIGLLLLSRLGKRLAVLDGLVKSRLEPCRQQDNILQTQGEEWRHKQSHRAGKTYLRPGHAAVRPWLGQTGQTRHHSQALREGPGPSGRLGSRKGEAPSASNLSSEKFSAKMTFVPFDCVDNGILMTSERDLERQGRPSRGTPTPPGYGYLTRHLPRKVAHARISDSATDEQVLMLGTRGKKHGFIPECSGLSSHKEQTNLLGVTMVPRLRRRQRRRRFSRPTADVLVLKAITSRSREGTITNGTPGPFPQERTTSTPEGLRDNKVEVARRRPLHQQRDNDLRLGRLDSSSDGLRAKATAKRPSFTSPHGGREPAIKAKEPKVRSVGGTDGLVGGGNRCGGKPHQRRPPLQHR